MAAFVVTGMVTTMLGPILPELVETWHLSDSAAGALFTAQFSGSLSAGAISGLLVSRIGDARTLALGYGTMSAGLVAIAAGGYASGVVGAFAAGTGMGFVIPPTNLLVARGRRDRAASALGMLNLSWGVGAAVWPLVVSAAVRLGGMRSSLAALAVLCAAAAIAFVSSVGGHDGIDSGSAPTSSSPVMRVALFGVLIWLYSGTEMALGGWLPELARRLPAAASGAASATVGAAFWGGLSAGRGLIAVRLDRRYEDPSVFAGLAFTACGLGTVAHRTGRRHRSGRGSALRDWTRAGLSGDGGRGLPRDAHPTGRSAARTRLSRGRDRALAGRRHFRHVALARDRCGLAAPRPGCPGGAARPESQKR